MMLHADGMSANQVTFGRTCPAYSVLRLVIAGPHLGTLPATGVSYSRLQSRESHLQTPWS